MMAWRNSLATQINQFQESAQWAMPNLPNLGALPALPNLPDYQGNPMVRRVSSLFPQRPASRQTNPAKEGWWESLTGSSSPPATADPPAYNELFPNQETQDSYALKKISAVQAAADAAADLHFEAQIPQGSSLGGSSSRALAAVPEDQRTSLQGRHIQRVELSRDRKLFFFWIPLLAILLGLILKNSMPGVLYTTLKLYKGTQNRGPDRVVEIA
jgi:hypothetical protein